MALVRLAFSALGVVLWLAPPACASTARDGADELRLANGMRVSVVPVAGARTFSLQARIDAGPLHDPPGQRGLAAMAAEWLAWPVMGEDVRRPVIRWTHDHPSSSVSPRWLELRASGRLGAEASVISVLAGRLASVADAARHGVRPELWERFREAAARSARAAADSVDGQLWALARAALFASGSSPVRLGWASFDEASVSPEALQGFLRARVIPQRIHLVLAGDFRGGGPAPPPRADTGAHPGPARPAGDVAGEASCRSRALDRAANAAARAPARPHPGRRPG